MSKVLSPASFAKKLSFGGHESFPFRLGWIRKGIEAAAESNAFNAPDAVVRLGVGKNMVRSIRTWCLATQMLEERPVFGSSRVRPLETSDAAKVLFSSAGDPYLEDPGSLWLLHWLLLTNPDRLSLWRIAFMFSRENEFTKSGIVTLAQQQADREGKKIEALSVARDADVFIRTYVGSRSTKSEEDFSCPLTELNLITSGGGDRYSFVIGAKRSLPTHIFGFAFLQFLDDKESLECSLSDATYLPGSPGQAFKLDEDSVVAHLRALAANDQQWFVNIDGPIRRIAIHKKLNPYDLLRRYYRGGAL